MVIWKQDHERTEGGRDMHTHYQSLNSIPDVHERLKLYIVQYGIHKTHVAIKIFNQN